MYEYCISQYVYIMISYLNINVIKVMLYNVYHKKNIKKYEAYYFFFKKN